MPTKHPRKSVTFTPDVEQAVTNLERHGGDASLGELVKVGAETMLSRLVERQQEEPDPETLELRRRFLELSGSGVFDLDVALTARDEAWTH